MVFPISIFYSVTFSLKRLYRFDWIDGRFIAGFALNLFSNKLLCPVVTLFNISYSDMRVVAI